MGKSMQWNNLCRRFSMAYTKEILTLAVEIGDEMLRNGAEIYRVEDTVIHILKAYQIEEFDVYVLSNGIFASANENKEDACSMIRHIPLGSVHLDKISALNQLTRDICTQDCALTDAWVRLEECRNLKPPARWLQVLCCGIGSSGFAYLFGGELLDLFFSFMIGILLQLVMFSQSNQKMARFSKSLFYSMFVTALSLVPFALGAPVMQDKIVIGAIMPLVPGIAFTTSIRDFYNGDYLSGTIHLIDALMTALCIAAGVGIVISIYQAVGGKL